VESEAVDDRSDPAALLARAEAQLTAVDDALRRLDEGTYGVCVRCGDALAADQLAADPLAVACPTCPA